MSKGLPPPPFERADLPGAKQKLLRDGRVANAVVMRVEYKGTVWTVKDFSSRPWVVRNILAPLLLSHELNMLKRLSGIDGIAAKSFRIDRHAMAVEFMSGKDIGSSPREKITPQYLLELEQLIDAMHGRNVVHLDLRGPGNVMVRDDGTPGIIDFQSALNVRWFPKPLRRLLMAFDRSGAYKKWLQYCPESMGDERREALTRINRWRKFWIFSGYFGMKKH